MSNHIDELRIKTAQLPNLEAVGYVKGDNCIEYNVPKGTSLGLSIYKTEHVAIQRAFLSNGTVFPKHIHNEIEWLIVYKGAVIVRYKNESIDLGVGDSIRITPDREHSVFALEDTWLIGITVPAAKGYPNGSSQSIE